MQVNKSAREKLVETTSRLLQRQGYHATGLNQITKESGAPKGSLYYYFPNGKEELAREAVQRTNEAVAARIAEGLSGSEDAVEAIQHFVCELAAQFTEPERFAGVPVAAVALETALTSEVLRQACRDAYTAWSSIFADKLMRSGFSPERAEELGTVINAMIEGAFILCVTERSNIPLQRVARALPALLRS